MTKKDKEKMVVAEKKYSTLTKDTVSKINVLTKKNLESWVQMGELVHEFVLKVTENRTIWVDACKILASSPDSQHKDSQLRNYESAYLLWKEMGEKGETVSVSMTHMLAVIHSGSNFDKKLSLLREAEAKNLSVSQLKEIVKAKSLEKKRIAETKAKNGINYETSVKRVKGAVSRCYSHLTEFSRIKAKKKLPKEVHSNLIYLIEFVIAQNLVDLSELSINNNINNPTMTEERKVA